MSPTAKDLKGWKSRIDRLKRRGPRARMHSRVLYGIYAIASICYHGNGEPVMSDEVYNELCRWLLKNVRRCRAAGASFIDPEMLRCCTGVAVDTFVKPYHDLAASILGHACQCVECQPRQLRESA